jgi:hypothetical protein
MPAIEAVRLLDCVSPDWREQAKQTQTVTLLPDGISGGVQRWGEGILQENYQKINRYVGYGGGRPTVLSKMLSRPQSRSQFVREFLQGAINANFVTPEASGKRSPAKLKAKAKAKDKAKAADDGKPSRPRATRGHKQVRAFTVDP